MSSKLPGPDDREDRYQSRLEPSSFDNDSAQGAQEWSIPSEGKRSVKRPIFDFTQERWEFNRSTNRMKENPEQYPTDRAHYQDPEEVENYPHADFPERKRWYTREKKSSEFIERIASNLIDEEFSVRLAMTIEDIEAQSAGDAKDAEATFLRYSPSANRWWYRVVSQSGNPSGYLVRFHVVMDPTLREELQGAEDYPVGKLPVLVGCTCPAWRYWGADYNANSLEYLDGKPRSNLNPPDIHDPERKNLVCKHVHAAIPLFKDQKISI